MKSSTSRRALRGTASLAVTGAVALGSLFAIAPAAHADPASYNVIDRQVQGVTSDALPTTQIDGIAWDQKIVGNTVYVGGEFSNARPAGAAAGTSLTPRANMLAYDITTGNLVDSFSADTNARVNVLALSPDKKRLYVGGAFTTVGGKSRYRLAAINTEDGSLVNEFQPSVDASVNSIVATNDAVYVGGVFSKANGVARTRLAAFSPADGSLLDWAPTANRNVKAMTLTPDQSRVIVGGQFSTINGATARGSASIDAKSGALYSFALNQTVKNGTDNTGIYSLTTDGTNVVGTAYNYTEGVYEGVFMVDPYTGKIKWLADCHGDTYDATIMNHQVYSVSHHHNCENVGSFPQQDPIVYKRADAWTYDATSTVKKNVQQGYSNYAGNPAPSQIDWYPDLSAGSYSGMDQAAWTSESNDTYLVLGGEFPKVNGTPQQGLVRFAVPGTAPSKDAPLVGGSELTPTATVRGTTATLNWKASWDRDNEALSYEIVRDDNNKTPIATLKAASLWWDRPSLTWSDTTMEPGKTYTYWIFAVDADGNRTRSGNVTVTAGQPIASDGYLKVVLASKPQHLWRLDEASGTAIADSVGSNPMTANSYVTRNVAGILDGDAASSFTSNWFGNGSAAANTAETAPASHTAETWFKTTTTSGGVLMDFGSSRTGSSSSHDREVYMTSNGRLAFSVNTNGTRHAVVSTASYNDGKWHHVATTLSDDGMKLYVDGNLVASNAAYTSGQSFTGYWRLGGDATSGLASAPSSKYFVGTLDEAAVYTTALPQATIRDHAMTGGAKPANTAPVAAFTNTCDAAACSFDGTTSSDSESGIKSYAWSFGDGSTGTGATATHTYAGSGNYQVSLTVTDDMGATTTVTRSVVVKLPNKAPVAAFTTSADALTVQVDGSSSTDDGAVEKYEWDFGDGSTGTGSTASHTYAAAGTYTVTLTVTDDAGATTTTTRQVTVLAGASVVASDAFGNAETKWGTADLGGAWSYVTGGSAFSTDGSVGRMTLGAGATGNASLAQVSATDVVVTADVAIDKQTTGGGVNVMLAGRRTSAGEYRAKLRLLADGTARIGVGRTVGGVETVLKEVAVPGGYTPGQALHVQLAVTGKGTATVAAKAWTGDSEPANPTVSVSDTTEALQVSGAVGFVGYASSTATNAPFVISVDNYTAVKSA